MSSLQPVLLGLAAPSAANAAGSLLERTLESVAEPFAMILDAVAETLASEEQTESESDAASTNLDALQIQLASQIEEALSAAGIELNEPIELRISPTDGSIEVVGDHPQRALIESALADEPDLAAQFAELLALRQATEVDDEESNEFVSFGEADSLSAVFLSSENGAELTLV
jgi:hypothetical protein